MFAEQVARSSKNEPHSPGCATTSLCPMSVESPREIKGRTGQAEIEVRPIFSSSANFSCDAWENNSEAPLVICFARKQLTWE